MRKQKNNIPDYKAIYNDILHQKFPNKIEECLALLNKRNLSAIDILTINKKIFGTSNVENTKMSQKFRSYSEADILYILDYQKKHNINNKQLANHFKLSRNTIAKWKKIFLI
ncbi:helix-turn-helix domain-containing protein [Chryseobacterium culicis]|uniref:helix-turn-helix domain-containing protein n=1 Tax=Chryseobacterium culicis TaxID=680127 RepID=UPI00289E7A49|nr:helix-turn-helix domain-containing protein [Chryseobacterium culicis]